MKSEGRIRSRVLKVAAVAAVAVVGGAGVVVGLPAAHVGGQTSAVQDASDGVFLKIENSSVRNWDIKVDGTYQIDNAGDVNQEFDRQNISPNNYVSGGIDFDLSGTNGNWNYDDQVNVTIADSDGVGQVTFGIQPFQLSGSQFEAYKLANGLTDIDSGGQGDTIAAYHLTNVSDSIRLWLANDGVPEGNSDQLTIMAG